jgi:hypothetical protein
MKKLFRIVQFAGNLGIVCLAVLLGFITFKEYVTGRTAPEINGARSSVAGASDLATAPARPSTAAIQNLKGTKLPLPDDTWTPGTETVVLYLSTTCHFCRESQSFYQGLLAKRTAKDFKVVAVFPEKVDEAQHYLSVSDLGVDRVVSKSLDVAGIYGTPTLMIVGSDGIVLDSWRGKLTPDRENEVIQRLLSAS